MTPSEIRNCPESRTGTRAQSTRAVNNYLSLLPGRFLMSILDHPSIAVVLRLLRFSIFLSMARIRVFSFRFAFV